MCLVGGESMKIIESLFNKKQVDPEVTMRDRRQKAAQDWLPIFDIKDNTVYRRDGEIVSIVKIQPLNIKLLTANEQKVKINALLEALNGMDFSFQIFITAKPVDLDGYIAKLEMMKEYANTKRKRLLEQYIKTASRKASSGEALERNFYIICSMLKDKKAGEAVLFEKAREVAANLTSAGLSSHVCNEQDLRDLYFTFAHPVQSAVERSPLENIALPPLYSEGF